MDAGFISTWAIILCFAEGINKGAELEVEQLGLKPAPIWDAGSGSFTYYTTVSGSQLFVRWFPLDSWILLDPSGALS